MKRLFFALVISLLLAQPCSAGAILHMEVLQIGCSDAYDAAYEGILDGLARQGLAKGCNLDISRTVMDINPEPTLWQRLFTGFSLRGMAARAIEKRPDLVITLGTQATEAFQEKMAEAGIPVLFSCVCPRGAGSGENSTGVVIRPQPSDMIRTTILALPNAARLGIVHTSDPEARAFTKELVLQAKRSGLVVIEKEIDPSGPFAASAREVLAQGVDAFIIPTDSCYETNGGKASRDLIAEATLHRIPCVSAVLNPAKGSLITLSPDFSDMGNLTAAQAKAILSQGRKPAEIAVASHVGQSFIVDLATSRRLGIQFRPRANSLYGMNR